METYVLVPLWLTLWLAGFLIIDIFVSRKRNPTFRSLILQLRIWELAMITLLFFSFTRFEKTSLLQTAVLMIGPMLSLFPIARFWIKRRALLQEL